MSVKKAAVFLDRDGTIIEDRGHLVCESDAVFFPETFTALRQLQDYFLLFIITNQPGIAEGVISYNDVKCVNEYVIKTLDERGIRITDIYVCPHRRSDGCLCIKPKPYFLNIAASNYALDLRRSFIIGDHPHDIELARNVGAEGIYVLTGHGQKHLQELPNGTITVAGIMQAAEKIMASIEE